MKNVYEVLKQKEQLLQRTQKEVDSLRLVAPLLADAQDVPQVIERAMEAGVGQIKP